MATCAALQLSTSRYTKRRRLDLLGKPPAAQAIDTLLDPLRIRDPFRQRCVNARPPIRQQARRDRFG
jgi:hypothetical protein